MSATFVILMGALVAVVAWAAIDRLRFANRVEDRLSREKTLKDRFATLRAKQAAQQAKEAQVTGEPENDLATPYIPLTDDAVSLYEGISIHEDLSPWHTRRFVIPHVEYLPNRHSLDPLLERSTILDILRAQEGRRNIAASQKVMIIGYDPKKIVEQRPFQSKKSTEGKRKDTTQRTRSTP